MENEAEYSKLLWKAIKDACYQINKDEGAFEHVVPGGFTPRKVEAKLKDNYTIDEIIAEIDGKGLFIDKPGPDTIFTLG
jgi:6-phosphogluconolactonase/glucosamine-6-phosphate isomerase/deaminase